MVVRLPGGKDESDDDPQIIDAVLVACAMTRIRGAKATGTPCTSSTKFTITIPLAP